MSDESEMIYGFISTLEKELELGVATNGYFVTYNFDNDEILPITFSFDPHDAESLEKVREVVTMPDNATGFALYSKSEWIEEILNENPMVPTVVDAINAILNRISEGKPESLVFYRLADMLIASNLSLDFIIDNELRQGAVPN